MNTGIFLNKPLQNDKIYVKNKLVSFAELTGHPVAKGMEKAVISEGTIVNVVSKGYGHLPNEKFFKTIEKKLKDADINFVTRSINRNNSSFAVDYILSDERYHINVKNSKDKIKPMMRFTNSYDGSAKTSGWFGMFREVCSNGLHVAESSKIGFNVKHRGEIVEIVLPKIDELIEKFISNEYYSLHKKFEVLAETPIKNVEDFVKYTLGKTGLFKYEASEKNSDPSLNARMVIETINREASELGSKPNLWLGYNAFNELLHGKLKKTFENQKKLDGMIFDAVSELVN